MSTHEEAAIAIREMLATALHCHREGVLSTVSADGRPHACWMGTVATLDFSHLITVTGSHTDKVANIRANPLVEWMFTSLDRNTIIYFDCSAEILMDVKMRQRYFEMVPEESRGYFTKYYHAGGDWCVINTRIESAVYCMPGAYMKVRIPGIRFASIPMGQRTTAEMTQNEVGGLAMARGDLEGGDGGVSVTSHNHLTLAH